MAHFYNFRGKNSRVTAVFKKKTFFILQNMFRHSYVIFSCKCSTVIRLNFNCIHDYVIELRHKIHDNNLNIGIHWEQRTARANSS